MLLFLDQEQRKQPGPAPPRCARVQVIVANSSGPGQLYELIVNLDDGAVVSKEHLEGKHSYIDSDYMRQVEEACCADPRVQEEIRKLELPENATVLAEPWAYATDGMNDMSERTTMVSSDPRRRLNVSDPTVLVLYASPG